MKSTGIEATELFKDRSVRFRVALAALVISLTAHLVFLLIAGGWRIHGGGGMGAGAAESAGPIEMAVVTETELAGALDEAALDTALPGVNDPELSTATPAVDLADSSGGSGLPDADELGSVGTGIGGAGTGEGIGIGAGEGGSGRGGAKFFGVEAGGNRFIYIVDISGSMQGPKLAIMKRELMDSIRNLLPHSQFMIWFFESVAHPLADSRRWFDATDQNKEKTLGAIQELQTRGGTVPAPAFNAAFALKPRADAIYFMTDGNFDEAVVEEISRLNSGGSKVPIHCIAFADRSGEKVLRKIAQESQGTYTFVKGPDTP